MLGIAALLGGGAIGYAVGNSNTHTKFRTKTVAGATKTVTTPSTGVTATTPGKTATTPGKTVTTPGKTVTAPGKTVTTPAVTRTVTATQTKTVTTSTTTTPTGTQNFSGANRQNLGTIHVASQSLLRWSCAGCSGSAVTISNNPGDPGSIGVNSQNAASGETAVAAGTYTAVTVTGSGPWSFTIAPGGG
jgi:hypothetical protein